MSASNWDYCPSCAYLQDADIRQLENRIQEDYGKIDKTEYMLLIDRLRDIEDNYEDNRTQSFREDYEIYGAEIGTITISYRGSCRVCGLSINFTHEVPFFQNGKKIGLSEIKRAG